MVRKFDGQQDVTICEMTLSGSHLIATYVRRCGGRRRTLVGRWAGSVDRRACGFEAALSTTELQATTLLVYNNLPLVLMLWPGNWQIYVCDKKFEGQWKTKKNGLGFEAALSTTELPTNILYTTPLFLCWSFWQVRKNIEELRLWLFSLILRMGDAQLFLLLTQA